MCNGCRYQVPGFDSFRPGQVFNTEEFIKMLSEAEHDICPACGQELPKECYGVDLSFTHVDEED